MSVSSTAARPDRDALGRRFGAAVAALLLTLAFVLPAGAKKDAAVDFWLTILHNNDGESKLLEVLAAADDPSSAYAGIARFVTLVNELEHRATSGRPSQPGAKRGVITLSSGDNFLAGAEFSASLENGVPFYDSIAANLIGYDAMAIGNHEFDFGPDILADYISGVDASIPFVSANLDLTGEPALQALADAGRIVPSLVIEQRGEEIGIVGATTPQLPNISSPRNVVVNAVAPAVQAEVDSLTDRGINKIILISHLQDVAEDLALATELRGIDVMIAGGGDELLINDEPRSPGDASLDAAGAYPLTATGGDGAQIPVVTTAGNYKYVGRLAVGFNDAGQVIDIDEALSGPVRVVGLGFPDGVAPDATAQALVVDPIIAFVADLAANVLAQSEVDLNGLRGTVAAGTETILTEGVRNSETNLGNLTADSMLWQAQQKAAEFAVDAPQVAMQNGGGIRNETVIPAGPITELNTFQILAFSNFVSVMEDVTADRFKVVLETSVSAIGNGRFGHWSGVEFTYDPTAQAREIDGDTCVVGAPGSRVQDVFVDGVQIFDDGTFVGPAGWTVDIATNDFTFRGGDCYDFGSDVFTTVGVSYQQALANYLVEGVGGLITAAQYPEGGEGRITRL